MDIKIRTADADDIPSIIGLMRDFAAFESLDEYFVITERRLRDAMFSKSAFVEGLIGFDGPKEIAYALFYPHFASFTGQRGFYLEDLYIDNAYRGKGIGESLLKEIAKIARLRGFERIDFQVLDWNTPAVRFYEKLGAVRNSEELHFKFAGAAFDVLAS